MRNAKSHHAKHCKISTVRKNHSFIRIPSPISLFVIVFFFLLLFVIFVLYRDLQYCGRAFSTIASSPLTSSVKGSWKKQDGLALSGAFVVGWACHTLISMVSLNSWEWILVFVSNIQDLYKQSILIRVSDIYYRREHYYKVDRMLKESDKRSEAAIGRSRQYFLVRKV